MSHNNNAMTDIKIEEEKNVAQLKETKEDLKIGETILALILFPNRTAQAKHLGIGVDALYWRLNKYPVIRERVAKIPEVAIANLQAGSIQATEVLRNALEERGNKMEAAKDILDRIGAKDKTPNSLTQLNFEQNINNNREEVDPDELANEMVSLIEGIESIRPEEVQPDSTTGTAEEGKVITSPN